jgi:hypothetical protein
MRGGRDCTASRPLLNIEPTSYSRPEQADVFRNDLAQRLRAAEASQRIQNLDAGRPAFRVVVGRNPLRQMLGRHRGVQKLDVKSVYFRIIGNLDYPIYPQKQCERDNWLRACPERRTGLDIVCLPIAYFS